MSWYTFMPKLLNMSLTAGVAIVFVILMRLLLRKAPKVISYALWGVVLFRLLFPVSIESGLSLYNLLDVPTVESGTMTSVIEYVPENIVHTEYPSVILPVPGISNVINNALPQGQEQLVADPLEAPTSLATYIWMIGVLVMVIYSIVSYIQLHGKLLASVKLRDNIFIADDIDSPFVMGLIRSLLHSPKKSVITLFFTSSITSAAEIILSSCCPSPRFACTGSIRWCGSPLSSPAKIWK